MTPPSSLPKTIQPRPCAWDVDGLTLHGLDWGPHEGTPVLALHGWMDHAASFQELAPLLGGCHVVALDLSGQGLSDHRAAHATYNIWDDLPQIVGVLDQLGWDRCVVMGHSRGANIGALLAAALPDRLRALISLDALVPEPIPEGRFATTLSAFVQQTRKQNTRPPRLFADTEEYAQRRQQQGNAPATSRALAPRALEPTPEGMRLRGDARLFASSAVKLTRGDVASVMGAIECPVLNIWAQDGLKARRAVYGDLIQMAQDLIGDYRLLELPGDHHFHLDPACAPQIAAAISDFLAELDG